MKIYVGFDDTDTIDTKRGTGKLARMFEDRLPDTVKMVGVVRQQLPKLKGIPFTSHNSSACVILESGDRESVDELIELASEHLKENFVEGSDPGLCVAGEGCSCGPALMEFGRTCCSRIVTQKEAMRVSEGIHCSGHGGTNDGIIGAVAGVGLTMMGWNGRFIEFGRLRDFPPLVTVGELQRSGIRILGIGRDAMALSDDDLIDTGGWLRPQLVAGFPVVMVDQDEKGWYALGKKQE